VNIDPSEVEKFEKLAHRWWDAEGEFKPLHDINPLRLQYVQDRLDLDGIQAIEVGCGGGIFTETLCEKGAQTIGIDPAVGPLTVAKIHALEQEINDQLAYEVSTAEEYVETHREYFDGVFSFEMLEHVPDFRITVQALADLAKPGTKLFFSTINRHPIAYITMVVAGEYLLDVLPKGTHEYDRFIKPSELAQASRDAGLLVKNVQGYRYNPFSRHASFCDSVDVNYLMYLEKPAK